MLFNNPYCIFCAVQIISDGEEAGVAWVWGDWLKVKQKQTSTRSAKCKFVNEILSNVTIHEKNPATTVRNSVFHNTGRYRSLSLISKRALNKNLSIVKRQQKASWNKKYKKSINEIYYQRSPYSSGWVRYYFEAKRKRTNCKDRVYQIPVIRERAFIKNIIIRGHT